MCDTISDFTTIHQLSIHVSLEGNIGAGKSTLLEMIQMEYGHYANIAFVKEPVDEWQKLGYLEGVYNGTHHPAVFQSYALSSVMRAYMSAAQSKIIIQERSVQSSYHVFAKANLNVHDLKMFKSTWDNTCALIPPNARRVYIYLQTTPFMSHLRMRERARAEERSVPLDYINLLHELHESWLLDWKDKRSEVHIVNANCTAAEVRRTVLNIIKQIFDSHIGNES